KVAFLRNSSSSFIIGRDKSCDVTIDDSSISKQHAQLLIDKENNIYITDYNSTNGVYINNTRISPSVPTRIGANDTIKLSLKSDIRLVFNPDNYQKITPSGAGQSSGGTTNIIDKFKNKTIITIGRSPKCDVVIDHSSISREHASIEKKSNNVYILKDLNSLNGTFLNGAKISSTVKIGNDDTIFIGRYKLSLTGETSDLSNEVAIRIEGISKVFSNGKTGLHKCSFEIPSKTLMAVMGPSGCGKSTLLKALNGDSPPTTGRVYIGGLDLSQQYDYLKTLIGYVPQDDIVHRELTVEQSLYYAAKLRLQNTSKEFVFEKVEKALNDLNIKEIRKNLVGEISGGQRKRVSIAVEILTDPLILFLDEPTSPLDPQTIEEFLGILRNLAKNGTTVIMVTHKPEDLNYMDSVIFMAEGGHLVYKDNAKKYLGYFNVDDTVKVYSTLVKEKAKIWVDKFRREQAPLIEKPKVNIKSSKSPVNYFSQYYWLTIRYFNIKFNDRKNTALLIGQAPIIALLICLIFKEVNLAVPFLIAVSAVWFGTNNAAREIVGEIPIYKRERMFNQGVFPYILSKITVLASFAAVQCFIFIFIISLFFKSHDPNWTNPMTSFFWMLILSIAASLMGLLLSAIVTNTEKVMTIVPLALIPQIMLAGVVAKIENKFVEILSYFSLSRWGTEGFAIKQELVAVPNIVAKEGTGVMDSNGTFIEPEMIEDGSKSVNAIDELTKNFHPDYENIFGTWHSTFKLDFLVVTLISLLFFMGIYFALKRKDSMKIK
ncbi:MAG: FHA domain-containing protein, partial [Flavobacteriia bacterium]